MKAQVIVPTRLLLGLTALVVFAAAASVNGCANEQTTITSGAGAGTGSSSSTSGAGGSAPDAGPPNPLADTCASLCSHLDAIQCTAWPKCSTECLSGFNAPGCQAEVKALLECWVANQADFTCSMTQLIPPIACKDLETKFNDCLTASGTGSTGSGGGLQCVGGIVNGTATTCSVKTQCSDNVTEVKSTCALTADNVTWACSCYSGDALLGTCSSMDPKPCDNEKGCCAPFFALIMP